MPEYVIANATVVPVRENPSEAAEQLTQLLFAEPCEVLDRLPRWTKIRSLIDGQEGWVDFKMVTLASNLSGGPDKECDFVGCSSPLTSNLEAIVATPMAPTTPMDGGADLLLTLGTRLPNYSHGTFEFLGQQYLIDPTCVNLYQRSGLTSNNEVVQQRSDLLGITQSTGEADLQRSDLATIAQSLLNAPYLWGGKNAMGMDCSGFVQVVYAAMGVNLLRNAREQMTQGDLVPSLAEARPGDLAFFDHADRDPKATNISHVGLLLSPTEIIHCSGCVHIDTIDEQGIHLPDGELTHHLVQIKRYL